MAKNFERRIYQQSIFFTIVNLKNELFAFLGWPYYILERLTILYAMFNFIGFFFSLMKGIYNPCLTHTQVNRQASVARIFFCRIFFDFSPHFFRFFST